MQELLPLYSLAHHRFLLIDRAIFLAKSSEWKMYIMIKLKPQPQHHFDHLKTDRLLHKTVQVLLPLCYTILQIIHRSHLVSLNRLPYHLQSRSEERRVGKEFRCRCPRYEYNNSTHETRLAELAERAQY